VWSLLTVRSARNEGPNKARVAYGNSGRKPALGGLVEKRTEVPRMPIRGASVWQGVLIAEAKKCQYLSGFGLFYFYSS
jgi:hypothetical protein